METELSGKLLNILSERDEIDTLELSKEWNEDHQKIIGIVKSIEAYGDVISTEQKSHKMWELTEEGSLVAEKGSHEALVFKSVSENGTPHSEIMNSLPKTVSSVGFSKAMSCGWIAVDKSSGSAVVFRKVSEIVDVVQNDLKYIKEKSDNLVSESQKQQYKKRKLLDEITVKSYIIRRGKNFTTSLKKCETELTPEMISSGSWKDKTFKSYNFDALGVSYERGNLHLLLKARAEFRQIFLEMGFTEMPSNNFVESSFWNFDALFQPQQHPARDAHDTFFVSDPQFTDAKDFPENYLQNVKRVHSLGDYGSQGYKYDWKLEDAQKNLLRTHTTAVSAKMLYKLAQNGFKPVKYFSIDKVFRNETLDATHLAEFQQIEGVIADYDLTLGDLIGVLNEFFKKLGLTKLRFKPAYNPYTEPSMEIFSFHEELNKWIEVGNSGMFRPEMLLPMGLPSNVNVIAWGLSLERPTMIKYKLKNIRDLVGPKVDLQMIQSSPICRLSN